MKKKFKFLTLILSVLVIICSYSSTIVHATSNIDITTSSVRDDLESMDMDKLSFLSDTENLFITMSQYYDNENNLRSYLYFNYIGDVNERKMYVELSTAVMDSNYNITENYQYYELSFVNQEETWCKYEILNLPNLNETTRRYNINSIGYYVYTSQANIYTHIINEIGQTFIYNGITNKTIQVFHQEIETITITEKEVAFYCYGEDSSWGNFWGIDNAMGYGKTYTDVWYIFFNTDKQIDELLEIEITYKQYDYHIQYLGLVKMQTAITESVLQDRINGVTTDMDEKTTISYHNQKEVIITPGTTKVSASDNWWGGYETKYADVDNIMDLREYNHNDDNGNPFVFTEQAEKYTWGVNFLNTTKKCTLKGMNAMGQAMDTSIIDGSGVCNTAILRLKYMVNGITKNCYAVDVSTDDFSGNSAETDINSKFEEWFEKILMLVGVLILVILLGYISPIFSILFKGLITALELIFKGVITIISLPFKLIGKLLKPKNKKP